MSNTQSIVYRSLTNQTSRIWHFCTDCPDWPRGSLGYIERPVAQREIFSGEPVDPRVSQPEGGTVCTQCLSKWDDGSCQTA